nr:hypothetical protein [Sorangium cellulosum]
MRELEPPAPFTITRRAFVAALSAALSLAACSKAEPGGGQGDRAAGDYEVLELRHQGFAGVVSVPELAEDLGYLAPLKLTTSSCCHEFMLKEYLSRSGLTRSRRSRWWCCRP